MKDQQRTAQKKKRVKMTEKKKKVGGGDRRIIIPTAPPNDSILHTKHLLSYSNSHVLVVRSTLSPQVFLIALYWQCSYCVRNLEISRANSLGYYYCTLGEKGACLKYPGISSLWRLLRSRGMYCARGRKSSWTVRPTAYIQQGDTIHYAKTPFSTRACDRINLSRKRVCQEG